MAVVTPKSAAITNADATPPRLTNSRIIRGRLHESVGMLEAANGDDIASIYRLCRVPANARISQLLLSCDAITTGAADVGVYKTARDGGAVVDVDFFGSAVSIATALAHSDITYEADPADAGAGFGKADSEKPLWEALGLTADPGGAYDIALTLTAAAEAAGTMVLRTRYVE